MAHTERWHDERRLGIGGSDIAAIAGLSKYSSPMSVYLDKIGAGERIEQNAAMEWGTRLEETVAVKFADEHPEYLVGRKVEPDGDEFTFWHPELPWAYAHVDRQLYSLDADDPQTPVAVWECKTAGRESKYHNWLADDGETFIIPESVMAQVQWEIACLGVEFGWLSVLFEGREYHEFLIERDEELIQYLLEIGASFWKLVETRTPPAIDASEATKEVLAILYRETVSDEIDLEVQGAILAQERISLKTQLKDTEARLNLVENQLKGMLGEHETGRADGSAGRFIVTWKPQSRAGNIDKLALTAAYPEIAEQFTKPPTTFRQLHVKLAE